MPSHFESTDSKSSGVAALGEFTVRFQEMSVQEIVEFFDSCQPVDQKLASEVVEATRELHRRRN